MFSIKGAAFRRVCILTRKYKWRLHLISNKREWNHCFIKNAPKICKTKTKLETNQNILLLTLSIFIEHGTVAQKLDHLICNSRVFIWLSQHGLWLITGSFLSLSRNTFSRERYCTRTCFETEKQLWKGLMHSIKRLKCLYPPDYILATHYCVVYQRKH